MTELKIITNKAPRPTLSWWELSPIEQADFDWKGADECIYCRYKSEVYCISEFMRIDEHAPEVMRRWDGYEGESFFSGVVVKFCKDTDFVIMGRYIS